MATPTDRCQATRALSLSIRAAGPADADGIAAVRAEGLATLRAIYRPTPDAIMRKRQMPALPRLVAIVDEAAAVVGTLEYATSDERVHLMGLYVAAAYRQRGVARALIAKLARLAHPRPLSLDTIRETGNVAVFERLGFVVLREGPARTVVGDGPLTEVHMEWPPPSDSI